MDIERDRASPEQWEAIKKFAEDNDISERQATFTLRMISSKCHFTLADNPPDTKLVMVNFPNRIYNFPI